MRGHHYMLDSQLPRQSRRGETYFKSSKTISEMYWLKDLRIQMQNSLATSWTCSCYDRFRQTWKEDFGEKIKHSIMGCAMPSSFRSLAVCLSLAVVRSNKLFADTLFYKAWTVFILRQRQAVASIILLHQNTVPLIYSWKWLIPIVINQILQSSSLASPLPSSSIWQSDILPLMGRF